ncbi:phosphatidylserine decarboxylase family protein [Candidatus Nitronereus thalassa]|uniref:Phosphatidylserine decarboxylase proenzyme n=1 Tax=Candidatus Nitronereus thalassa TaxID=3020898 RepID=A0ABU3K7S8_9BACT|nr:phosphatidylserine decarboxylase family protein [Candidatus Nitronereus thalassa]MDT7042414.1 phosphatidylserine decarboxylase family protein [Candidatus Nitronereus thalassa]
MADRAQGIPIAKEGVPFVMGAAVPAVLAGFLGCKKVSFALGAIACFTGWFFRNPARTIPLGDDFILASGDGQIIAIQEEFEPRYLKEQCIRISIFLNIFDVHINRMPCAGTVVDVAYQPGQFINASDPDATVHNEQNALMIETPSKQKVLCVQVAGLIARRIVCWVQPGETAVPGERFGLIRFGSRMDTFFPVNSRIRVKMGDRVKGGESILAELV